MHVDQWIFTLELATSSVLDILLTCVLLYYLRRLRTGFAKQVSHKVFYGMTKLIYLRSLDRIIDKLSLYTLQSGLLPT